MTTATEISETAILEIPAVLGAAIVAGLGPSALPKWGRNALVAEGVREGLLTLGETLTLGEAAELLGLGCFEAEGVPQGQGGGARPHRRGVRRGPGRRSAARRRPRPAMIVVTDDGALGHLI